MPNTSRLVCLSCCNSGVPVKPIKEYTTFSKRELENRLRERGGFEGTPLRLRFQGREKDESDR